MCTTICTAANAMMRNAVACLLSVHVAHHQPERHGGEHDREHEADDIVALRSVQCAMRVVVSAHRSIPIR